MANNSKVVLYYWMVYSADLYRISDATVLLNAYSSTVQCGPVYRFSSVAQFIDLAQVTIN